MFIRFHFSLLIEALMSFSYWPRVMERYLREAAEDEVLREKEEKAISDCGTQLSVVQGVEYCSFDSDFGSMHKI